MGTIVTLPAGRRRRRIAVEATDGANILLFMGVRYVRDMDASPAVDRSRPASAIRDELPFALA